MRKKALANQLPFNIQFFADEAGEAADAGKEAGTGDGESGTEAEQEPDSSQPTTEELLLELSKAKAEATKLKGERDKALREKGEITKQLRAKQSAAEIAEATRHEEDEAHKAYVAELEEYKKRTEAEKRYALQGMTAELAQKAADAEIRGDMDELMKIQQQHTESIVKAKEAEWKKSRPQAVTGSGAYAGMTKEDIMAIKDEKERQMAIAQNLSLFGVRQGISYR